MHRTLPPDNTVSGHRTSPGYRAAACITDNKPEVSVLLVTSPEEWVPKDALHLPRACLLAKLPWQIMNHRDSRSSTLQGTMSQSSPESTPGDTCVSDPNRPHTPGCRLATLLSVKDEDSRSTVSLVEARSRDGALNTRDLCLLVAPFEAPQTLPASPFPPIHNTLGTVTGLTQFATALP